MHFEDLWLKCESFHKNSNDKVSTLIDELSLKINLYKTIDLKEDIPTEDKKQIKARTLGEILLTITHLSLIDDVNTFKSLSDALQYRELEFYSKKHST